MAFNHVVVGSIPTDGAALSFNLSRKEKRVNEEAKWGLYSYMVAYDPDQPQNPLK